MASSYVAGVNVSSGVMAKLQKWIGKASARPNEIRAFDKEAFVTKNAAVQGAQNQFQIPRSNALFTPIHVRTRSAPVPMPEMEVRPSRRRKASVTTPPPTHSLEKESEHESEKQTIHLEPKNGIPRAGASRSVGRNDSAFNDSSLHRKQYVTNSKGRNVGLRASEPVDETKSRGDFVRENDAMKEIIMNSRAVKKVNKTARDRSRDHSEDNSGASDNEKIGSSSGSPNGVQKQIETRLQKWVDKASLLGSKRNRVSSDESISSTDDSLNPSESPNSTSTARQDRKCWKEGKQAKEMQELKLALKELVENVGVRVGRTPEKDPFSSSAGLGRQRASLQPDFNEVKTAREKKKIGKRKYGSTEDVSVTTRSEGSRKNSSGSDSDGIFRVLRNSKLRNDSGVADKFNECELEDHAKCSLMNDNITNRELNVDRSPRARKSVILQEVLVSETLIEEFPKQEDDDITKKALLPNGKKSNDADRFGTRNIENVSSKAEVCKKHSGETDVSEVPKGTEYPKTYLAEGESLKWRNGISKKLERPGLQKRSTAPDSSSLRVCPDLTIRDSMRHYLNFKDAELSAFAEECVRHAIRKKRNSHEEDRNDRIDLRKIAATDEFPKKAADSTSSGDQSQYSTDALKIRSKHASLPNEETAKEIAGRDDNPHFIFARTAEEAEWFEKELGGGKRGKHAKDKASLERLHSNPVQGTESQRLYKFPSLPMFYTPQADEGSDPRRRSPTDKPLYRRSVAVTSFPDFSGSTFAYEPLSVVGLDREGAADSTRSKSKAKSSSSSKLDQVGKSKVEEKGRPFIRKRKLSVPSRLGRYSNSSLEIRVGIEAHI